MNAVEQHFAEAWVRTKEHPWVSITLTVVVCMLALKLFFTARFYQRRRPRSETTCIVVTGSASGIGNALVLELLRISERENLTVVGVDIRETPVSHSKFVSFCANVVDTDALNNVVTTLATRQLSCDALVLCAGITTTGPLAEMDSNKIKAVMDVNVLGTQKFILASSVDDEDYQRCCCVRLN